MRLYNVEPEVVSAKLVEIFAPELILVVELQVFET